MSGTREHIRAHGLLVPDARLYDWATTALLPRMYRRVAADVTASAAPGTRVLEVGAGTGALAARLAGHGITVTATDLDPDMVTRARKRLGPQADVRAADVADLPFEDGTFDLVLATLTVHHWPDILAASAEIARVLRPGGQILVWELAKDPTGRHSPDRLAHVTLTDPRIRLDRDELWPWPMRMKLLRRMQYTRR